MAIGLSFSCFSSEDVGTGWPPSMARYAHPVALFSFVIHNFDEIILINVV